MALPPFTGRLGSTKSLPGRVEPGVVDATTAAAKTGYWGAQLGVPGVQGNPPPPPPPPPSTPFTVTQDKATRMILDASATPASSYSWKMDGQPIAGGGAVTSVLAPSLGAHTFSCTVTDAAGTRSLGTQTKNVVFAFPVHSHQHDASNETTWNPLPTYTKWTPPRQDNIGPWPTAVVKNRLNEVPPVDTYILDPPDEADVNLIVHLGDKGTAAQATGDRAAMLFQSSYGGPSVGGGPSGQWHYDWLLAGLAQPIDVIGDHGVWNTLTPDPATVVPRFWRYGYRFPSIDLNPATWKWNCIFEFREDTGTAVFSHIPQSNGTVKVFGRSNQVLYTEPALVAGEWRDYILEYVFGEASVGYYRLWGDDGSGTFNVNLTLGNVAADAAGKIFTQSLAAGHFMTAGIKQYHSLVTTDYTTQTDWRKMAIGLSKADVLAIP